MTPMFFKIKMVALLLILFYLPLSCKKDYPEDIPQWLKQRIREIKRGNSRYIEIYEFYRNDTVFFAINDSVKYSSQFNIYDYYGNYLCVESTELLFHGCTFGSNGTHCFCYLSWPCYNKCGIHILDGAYDGRIVWMDGEKYKEQ